MSENVEAEVWGVLAAEDDEVRERRRRLLAAIAKQGPGNANWDELGEVVREQGAMLARIRERAEKMGYDLEKSDKWRSMKTMHDLSARLLEERGTRDPLEAVRDAFASGVASPPRTTH